MIIELEPWEIKLLRAGLAQLRKRAESTKKRDPNFVPEPGHINVTDARLDGIRKLMERLHYRPGGGIIPGDVRGIDKSDAQRADQMVRDRCAKNGCRNNVMPLSRHCWFHQ